MLTMARGKQISMRMQSFSMFVCLFVCLWGGSRNSLRGGVLGQNSSKGGV